MCFMTLCPNCRTIQKQGTICPLCKCPVDEEGMKHIAAARLFQGVGEAGYAMANMETEFPHLFQELPKSDDTSEVPF